jgi:hypothetical protein
MIYDATVIDEQPSQTTYTYPQFDWYYPGRILTLAVRNIRSAHPLVQQSARTILYAHRLDDAVIDALRDGTITIGPGPNEEDRTIIVPTP